MPLLCGLFTGLKQGFRPGWRAKMRVSRAVQAEPLSLSISIGWGSVADLVQLRAVGSYIGDLHGRWPMMSRTERERFLPDGLKTERIEVSGSMVVVHARASSARSACLRCGQTSGRQHSRYQRRLADLPAHGRDVRIVLSVRRLRCRTPHCRTRVFAERFPPSVTRPHGPADLAVAGAGAPPRPGVGRTPGASPRGPPIAAGEQRHVPARRPCLVQRFRRRSAA